MDDGEVATLIEAHAACSASLKTLMAEDSLTYGWQQRRNALLQEWCEIQRRIADISEVRQVNPVYFTDFSKPVGQRHYLRCKSTGRVVTLDFAWWQETLDGWIDLENQEVDQWDEWLHAMRTAEENERVSWRIKMSFMWKDVANEWRYLEGIEDAWWREVLLEHQWRQRQDKQFREHMQWWGAVIVEEAYTIEAREFLWWVNWKKAKDQAEEAANSLSDLRSILGGGRWNGPEFTREGTIRLGLPDFERSWMAEVGEAARLEKLADTRMCKQRETINRRWEKIHAERRKWQLAVCHRCGDVLGWPFVCDCDAFLDFAEFEDEYANNFGDVFRQQWDHEVEQGLKKPALERIA